MSSFQGSCSKAHALRIVSSPSCKDSADCKGPARKHASLLRQLRSCKSCRGRGQGKVSFPLERLGDQLQCHGNARLQAVPARCSPGEVGHDYGGALYLKDTEPLMLDVNKALCLVNHSFSLISGFTLQGIKLVPAGPGVLSVKQLNIPPGKISILPM